MAKPFAKLTPEELKAKLVELQLLQYDLYNEREIGRGNKVHSRIYKIAAKIRLLPDQGATLLTELTVHPRQDVSQTAAFLLIATNPHLAFKIFKKHSESDIPPISIGAWATLNGWRKGGLEIDWYLRENEPEAYKAIRSPTKLELKRSYWLAFFTSLFR